MFVFSIDGHVEVHFDEPFDSRPEMNPGDGNVSLGYIKYRNGDCSIVHEDYDDDQLMRWDGWMSETNTMLPVQEDE